MAKKKLVYINQTLGFGGAEVFITTLLTSLKSLGWQIEVYSNNQRLLNLMTKYGISTHQVKTIVDPIGDYKGLVKSVFLWPKLLKEYSYILTHNLDADVFLTSGFIEKILFSPLVKRRNKRIVWIEFASLTPIFQKFFGLPKLLYSLVKHLPETIVTSSNYSQRALKNELGVNNIKVVACGTDKKVKPKVKVNNDLVVCVSRLEEGKGQDLLIKAFAKVVKLRPSAKLHIVGEGDFLSTLQSLVKQYHLEDSIQFLGFVDDAIKEMTQAKVVVFPSVWSLEGFGLVVIEAMSLSKVVVAFANGPTPEIVDNFQTGLVVEKYSTKELAKAITLLLDNNKLSLKMGELGYKRYQQNYQIDIVAKQYSRILDK